MWIPKSEQEIIDAISNGSVNESSIFDAKRDLSSKNYEIAKDIAAMANDGGVIIYGLDEDDNGLVTELHPFPLKGQPERIDQVVLTSISEPPLISITVVPTTQDPSNGYIVVYIPQSDRSPHMVVVKGENRYYGRSAKGNMLLSESQVAYLYSRREKSQLDLDRLLDQEIASSTIHPDKNLAYLFLVSHPVYARQGFFGDYEDNFDLFQKKVNGVVNEANRLNMNTQTVVPFTINPIKRCADGILVPLGMNSNIKENSEYLINLKIDYDGTCHFFYGRAGKRINIEDPVLIFYEIIVDFLTKFLLIISELYRDANKLGMVDVGIAVTGLKESVVFTKDPFLMMTRPHYETDNYKKSGRFPLFLEEVRIEVVRKLLGHFIETLSQGKIDLFTKSDETNNIHPR